MLLRARELRARWLPSRGCREMPTTGSFVLELGHQMWRAKQQAQYQHLGRTAQLPQAADQRQTGGQTARGWAEASLFGYQHPDTTAWPPRLLSKELVGSASP